MKNLILKAIMAFLSFAIIGNASGMTPEQSVYTGVGGTVVSVFAKSPEGALRAGIDLSEVTSQLGAYWRKYEKQIWQALTFDLEFESYTTKISGVTDEYVSTLTSHTEWLQPYQKAYTPKGQIDVTPRINKVRPIKLDFTLDGLEDLYQTYLADMAMEDQADRRNWPFVKYIIMKHIIPGVKEELELMSGQGSYAAPTPGTPGGYMTSVDGILTVIAAEIFATNITPIATGAITAANTVDRVEFFNDSIDAKYDKKPGVILCSPEMEKNYKRDYRDTFGVAYGMSAKDNTSIDASNKILKGVQAFAGSDRLLFTPKENLITMYDKIYSLNKFDVQQFQREIYIMGDFKRGYGFRTLEGVFVNDQA